MGIVTIEDKRFAKPISYFMEDRVYHKLIDKIKNTLVKKDKDYLIAVDGAEGVGKSTLAFQLAKVVDPSFNLSRVVFSAEEFKQAIFKADKGQCIIYDEAFTGLSSRASLSGINRYLVSLMMQMRQKNLFVIIVLPTFFLLDKYVAIWRTKLLIHCYESGGNRGYFKVYGRRKKIRLFLEGRPTYSYLSKKIKCKLKGRFYGVFALGDKKEEDKYRKKKEKALEDTEKNPMNAGQVKYMEQRNLLLFLFRKFSKLKYRELANYVNDYDLDLSWQQIAKICAKFGDTNDKEIDNSEKLGIELEKEEKNALDEEELEEIDEIVDEDEDFEEKVLKKLKFDEENPKSDG